MELTGCHEPNQGDRDEIEDHDKDESPEIISRPVEDWSAHIGAQSRTDAKHTLKGSIDPSEISSFIEVGGNGHEKWRGGAHGLEEEKR